MPAVRQETITIRGELKSWRAFGEGWGFGDLRTSAEMIRVSGTLTGVRVGSQIECVGIWTDHPKYGRQFKFKTANITIPESSDGIVKWLASTLPDVGETRAQRLVAMFGAQLWEVIEQAPDALTKVEGITLARAEAIQAAYFKHKSDRDDMIVLRGWGLTDAQIGRCVESWGTLRETINNVRANPYSLSQFVHGFGFERADQVATKIGIAKNAPERIDAGIVHTLEEAAGNGHCFVWGGALQKIAAELLGCDAPLVGKRIRALYRARRVSLCGWRVYPPRLERAEDICAERIVELTGGGTHGS